MKTEDTQDAGSSEPLAAQSVAGQFSFTVKLDQSNDKSFNITGFVYAGDDVEAGNARIDMIDALVSRQITRSSIPVMEADLEQRLKAMDHYIDHLKGLQAQREEFSKTSKPTSLQRKQFGESTQIIEQSSTNIEAMKKDIETRRAAIQSAKAKVI
jgi:hypothetical protein